ncbi:YvrJ family protein [Alkalicoccus chagannorensis]|uniref:YvrJ family protein n=1 Tax=Alkalicoccus chagannorensis TaxID=427072 RepID=UPI00040E4609|nr:YvrJ family protein [Alkalicoccus chagannorensis]
MMQLPEWALFVGNVGFPVFVAAYLLTRFEKRIDRLAEEVEHLERRIRRWEDSG